MKTGAEATGHAYGLASLAEADAEELLAFNRGHWSVENKNSRDVNFREDDSRFSASFGPAINVTNIARAKIFHKAFAGIAQAARALDRQKGGILMP